MSTNRQSKHQQIVKKVHRYDKNDVYIGSEIEWNIPKIINSDITFQLYFGFQPPVTPHSPRSFGQSYSIDTSLLKAK